MSKSQAQRPSGLCRGLEGKGVSVPQGPCFLLEPAAGYCRGLRARECIWEFRLTSVDWARRRRTTGLHSRPVDVNGRGSVNRLEKPVRPQIHGSRRIETRLSCALMSVPRSQRRFRRAADGDVPVLWDFEAAQSPTRAEWEEIHQQCAEYTSAAAADKVVGTPEWRARSERVKGRFQKDHLKAAALALEGFCGARAFQGRAARSDLILDRFDHLADGLARVLAGGDAEQRLRDRVGDGQDLPDDGLQLRTSAPNRARKSQLLKTAADSVRDHDLVTLQQLLLRHNLRKRECCLIRQH